MTKNEKLIKLIEKHFLLTDDTLINEEFQAVVEDLHLKGFDENIVSIYRSKDIFSGRYVYGSSISFKDLITLSGQACTKKDLNVFIGYDAFSQPIFTGDIVAVYSYSANSNYKSILKPLPQKAIEKVERFYKEIEDDLVLIDEELFPLKSYFTGIAIKDINNPYLWLSCEHFGYEGESLLNKQDCIVLSS